MRVPNGRVYPSSAPLFEGHSVMHLIGCGIHKPMRLKYRMKVKEFVHRFK